jgi:Tol biopolymer transport system component
MFARDQSAFRAQLKKILSSHVFLHSPRMSRFLQFVVDTTLEGNSERIKEYVIAIEVFERPKDYDPQTDSTVRTEASKLRSRLSRYYETEGREDLVVISIPKGSYVPVFEEREQQIDPGATTPSVASLSPAAESIAPNSRQTRGWIIGATVLLILAAAAVISLKLRHAPEPVSKVVPLTAYNGVEGPPSLSPDGNFVAFDWTGPEKAGSPHIWIKAVRSEAVRSEAQRRLTETPASELNPAWSPDGSEIAFVRPDEGVFVVSELGGPERKVSNSGTHVGWATKPKSILIRDHEAEGRPYGIYQIFLDTLEKRRLTQAPSGIGDWRFEVSPDGATLAFIRYERPGVGDLNVAPMQGGQARKLTDWYAGLGGVTWTPDGREIVYSVESGPDTGLWRIPAHESGSRRGTRIPTNVRATMPSISGLAHDRPARLAFQTTTWDIGLRLIDLESPLAAGVIQAVKPIADSTRAERPGPFSPDGASMAFVSDRTGSPQLWLSQRDGSGVRQITSLNAAELVAPSWSPDGRRIAFSAAIRGNSDVYVADVADGPLKRLTSEASMDVEPWWSRDGRSIYFCSNRAGGALDIWRIPAEGGQAVRITESGGFEPMESPDGKYLFYLNRPPNEAGGSGSTRRVQRVAIGGGPQVVILDAVHPFWWFVADKGIFFVTREPEFDAIDWYEFETRRIERKGRLPFRASSRLNRLTVSRDGRWALLNELERVDSDLMLIDNFK